MTVLVLAVVVIIAALVIEASVTGDVPWYTLVVLGGLAISFGILFLLAREFPA